MRAVGLVTLFLAGLFGAVGVGSAARAVDTTTTDPTPTVPSAPAFRSVTGGASGIALLWNAPASDGGSQLTGFRLYRGVGKNTPTLLADLGRVDSYTDSAVTPGTTYAYQVSAVNAVGEGPLSDISFATAVGGAPGSLFQPYQATPVGSWPDAVAIGDVNGDGRNDVAMTTSYYFDPLGDFHLWVFLQAPDGTLSAPISYPTAATYGNGPDSVAIGDITGDGKADVVVGINGVGVQVFPQVVSGGLGSPTLYPSTNSGKIRLGQLNGDGRLDVAGVGWGTNTVDVLLNDGHGGLSAPVTYAAQHGGSEDLEVADATGDGRDDIVVMSGQSYSVPNVSVLPQLPAGGFGAAAPYVVRANTNTQGIGVGDVNGDGLNDVVASYGGNRPNSVLAVLAQTGSATLAAPVSYPSYDIPEPVDVADVNLDGRADVVTLHGGWLQAGIYLQLLDGTLGTEQLYPIPYASQYTPHGLAVGDINGDGSPDIVLADYNNGLVVLRNATLPTSAPAAPVLTGVVSAVGSISLTWTQPPSSGGSPSGYRVYRGTSSGGETLLASLGTTTSFTDGTAAPGTTYFYEVAAANPVGESARSNERSSAVPTAPTAPQLTAATAGTGGISLRWSPPASDGGALVTGYRVYRGTSNGSMSLLASIGAANTSYTDSSVTGGATYFYAVTAVNAVGESSASNQLSATAWSVPGAPTLTGAKGGKVGIALTWTAPASSGGTPVTGYRIYRGSASGGETLVATVGNVSAYTDTTAPNGKTAYYQVAAANAVGAGPRSNELAAKRTG
jgi:fibronectin type 3 domain-containing protein